MGLSDFLTVPFLISLGITFILVGILGMFLSQRIMDQNHKISSMMGLVSSVVDELNYVRSNLQMMTVQPPLDKQVGAGLGAGFIPVAGPGPIDNEEQSLISVSDDSEEEEDSDEDEDEDEENEIITSEDLLDKPTIKVIDMGETMNMNYLQEEEMEELEEDEELDDEELEEDDEELEEEELEELEEEELEEELEELEKEQDKVVEDKKIIEKPDIKKMNLQGLREFANSRGIMGDISKIKKAELIKMIEEQM